MALKSKKEQTNLPDEFEVNEQETQQVTWDDLEVETEFADLDAEAETKKYYTISGKEQQYEPQWERFGIKDLGIGDEFEGRPEVTIFEKEGKSYNVMRVRVMDDGEILDLYFNFPTRDYPYVKNLKNIRKSEKDTFDFYLNCFDVVFSVLRYRDERNVVNADGEEINKIKSINIETIGKLIDSCTRIGVRVIEGSPYNDYPSWQIYSME